MPYYDGLLKEFGAKHDFIKEFLAGPPAQEAELRKDAASAGRSGVIASMLTLVEQTSAKCRAGTFEHLAE
eukprot:29268-Pyramimonas_sp.AAC.1